MNYNITYPDSNGEVRFPGLDMGAAKCIWWNSLPVNIDRIQNGSTIVIKVTGSAYWASRGDPFKYSGTEFQVFRVLAVKEATEYLPRRFECERIIEIPVRKKNE